MPNPIECFGADNPRKTRAIEVSTAEHCVANYATRYKIVSKYYLYLSAFISESDLEHQRDVETAIEGYIVEAIPRYSREAPRQSRASQTSFARIAIGTV